MKVWALSDPHLSFKRDKPMHIFGEHWREHWKKIEAGWKSRVGSQDVVLVTGDISWARRMRDAAQDLAWLHKLPGRALVSVKLTRTHAICKKPREFHHESLGPVGPPFVIQAR